MISGDTHKLVCFNPRSRTGSDAGLFYPNISDTVFQSTLPHGERPGCATPDTTNCEVSIHAPARGATGLIKSRFNAAPLGFQSTLPHGERLLVPYNG